ncbi:hypothetical protein BIT28_12280 [Photobacterium proteolyticum]|uniref:DUF3299 domain-containing protein n=1 Tax=Photobacterium proteolyticum TaxID=1903952 RepID=A0A1Q9GBJ7_9GAMM|nr:hypothetical protein BIT28_12280 [Photobacterium proteolyticum]
MTRLIPFLLTLASFSIFANEMITLDWQKLRPETAQNMVTLPDLSYENRLKIQQIFTLMNSSSQHDLERLKSMKVQLKSEGIDADELLELREVYIQTQKKAAETTTRAFDGKKVRIPGFLVPIEFSDAMVTTDFLLVPFAGACIHMPPPPPNQIIRISFPEGYKMRTVQHPVWVEGTIISKIMSEEVYILDGASHITMGYSLNASKVSDYR